jgi:hypothetical protein
VVRLRNLVERGAGLPGAVRGPGRVLQVEVRVSVVRAVRSSEQGSYQGARAGGRESHGVGRGRAESE